MPVSAAGRGEASKPREESLTHPAGSHDFPTAAILGGMNGHGESAALSRRGWLDWTATGLGTAALAVLARSSTARGAAAAPAAAAPSPHSSAPARRAIHICLCGGLSQVDSFDYKPELAKFHGQKYGGIESADVFFGQIGLLRQSDWNFAQHGESGLWISDLFPHLAQCADE